MAQYCRSRASWLVDVSRPAWEPIARWLYSDRHLAGGARWATRCLPRCISRHFAEIDDGSTDSGQSNVIGLFTFIVAQVLAGIYFVQGKDAEDIPWQASLLYGVIAVAALIAMIAIVGNHKQLKAEGTAMYAYDRGTVVIGKWLILCAIALLTFFSGLVIANSVPGQGRGPLQLTYAGAVKKETVLPLICIDVPLYPHQFGGRIPSHFWLNVECSDELKGVQLSQASLFRITPNQYKEPIPNSPIVSPGAEPPNVELAVPVGSDRYVLEIYIQPGGVDVVKYESMPAGPKREKERKRISEKFLLERDSIVKQILTRGSIELSWSEEPK